MNRRWINRMAIQALALCLLMSTWAERAASAAKASDNQFGDQDRVTGNMIRALNAYAVYKMGQYESAFGQYLELAEEGSRQGMVNVANMYAQGQGVEKSQEKAFQWYVRAAESGDSISMVEVARAYDQGVGTGVDRHQACLLYTSPSPRDQRGSRMPSSA